MRYEVMRKLDGEIISDWADERAAIEQAEKCDEQAVVIAHEVSGTYESTTQVWPTRGETYSK